MVNPLRTLIGWHPAAISRSAAYPASAATAAIPANDTPLYQPICVMLIPCRSLKYSGIHVIHEVHVTVSPDDNSPHHGTGQQLAERQRLLLRGRLFRFRLSGGVATLHP